MSQKAKILAGFGAILVIGGTLIGISVANDAANRPNEATTNSQNTQQPSELTYVSYKGQDGKTALELLKATEEVETKKYEGIGEMVSGIRGEKAPSDKFWAFYVDGKQAQVGADTYVTKSNETIEWKLEKIQ